ncbi:hypothetical protein Agub_g12989 [Astrephomene gubernaculifera]|uniref:Uncharacterized protein n=1 Tax=Astrephomene gubernaculifera TaxID=47775 RepID=A0AAD3E0P3_9CHLO|nr:hypothetical protein Agub_g12989 [Astrephomene gubernaculifera]
MAPKKKKTGRKRQAYPPSTFEYKPPSIYELGVKPYLFVKCKICCTALPHLNFDWPAVPTELTVGAIKEAIKKRHGGGLPQLTLYKDVVNPEHSLAEVADDTMLKDLGIHGVYVGNNREAALPLVTFFYDFTAVCFDDAVAAVEPDAIQSKHDISLKLYRKLTAPQLQKALPNPAAPAAGSTAVEAGAVVGGMGGFGGAGVRTAGKFA